MSSGRNIVQERIKTNGSIFGNKSANLIELDTLSKSLHSELIRIQIPEIFPLADKTVKSHLELHAPEWRKLWDEFVSVQGSERALTEASKKVLEKLHQLITSTFETHPVSDDIINAIKLDPETQFMVRSTGEEDTVDMANPGGNKSVAAVKLDKQAISNAMGVVVASYVSEKSLTQRLLSGDDISKPSFMPVLIQRMIGEKVNGEDENEIVISGVMYAYENEVRIDAAPGHGELLSIVKRRLILMTSRLQVWCTQKFIKKMNVLFQSKLKAHAANWYSKAIQNKFSARLLCRRRLPKSWQESAKQSLRITIYQWILNLFIIHTTRFYISYRRALFRKTYITK